MLEFMFSIHIVQFNVQTAFSLVIILAFSYGIAQIFIRLLGTYSTNSSFYDTGIETTERYFKNSSRWINWLDSQRFHKFRLQQI